MQGIEVVTDAESKNADTKGTANLHERLREMNIVLGKGGIGGNVIRLVPPYCV